METGEVPRPARPAGWYGDPADPHRSRLWDGERWTSRVRPGRTYRFRQDTGHGFFVLAKVVLALLLTAGLFAGAQGLASAWVFQLLDGWVEDPGRITEAGLARVQLLTIGGGLGQLVLLVVAGIPYLTWLFLAYGSARVDPGVLRLARGWTLGSWVTPVVSWWFPRQCVADLWRGARAGLGHLDGIPGRWRLEVWWVSWLLVGALGQASVVLYPADTEQDLGRILEGLRAAAALDVARALVTVLAAGFAATTVREITAALWRPESDDPLPGAAGSA